MGFYANLLSFARGSATAFLPEWLARQLRSSTLADGDSLSGSGMSLKELRSIWQPDLRLQRQANMKVTVDVSS